MKGVKSMAAVISKIEIEQMTRLCVVGGSKLGYFHTWEHYSKPLPENPRIGGEPGGVFSKVFGIVEFSDGVQRVDPTDICFCDKENETLKEIEPILKKCGQIKQYLKEKNKK